MSGDATQPVEITDADVTFQCPWCGKDLAMDRRGAGLVITCPDCQRELTVPDPDNLGAGDGQGGQEVPRGGADALPAPEAARRVPVSSNSLAGQREPHSAPSGDGGHGQHNVTSDRSNVMIIDEKGIRETLRTIVKGVIVIAALSILKAIVNAVLRSDVYVSGMTVNSWIGVALSIAIVGMLIRLYRPVEVAVTFYLAALVKVGKLPNREKYLANLIDVAKKVTLLIFLLSIFSYIRPVILQCNNAFVNFRNLSTVLDAIVLLAVIGVLLLLWKSAHPLIDLVTGHITDRVSKLSSSIAYINCAKCNTQNDRDAQFCASCGAAMEQSPAPAPPSGRTCPKCSATNAASASFCSKCGSPL